MSPLKTEHLGRCYRESPSQMIKMCLLEQDNILQRACQQTTISNDKHSQTVMWNKNEVALSDGQIIYLGLCVGQHMCTAYMVVRVILFIFTCVFGLIFGFCQHAPDFAIAIRKQFASTHTEMIFGFLSMRTRFENIHVTVRETNRPTHSIVRVSVLSVLSLCVLYMCEHDWQRRQAKVASNKQRISMGKHADMSPMVPSEINWVY